MSQPASRSQQPLDDPQDALERLRATSGRLTGSRRDLVDLFYRHDEHVTAAEIAERLPQHDTATIYRALNHLEQAGIIEHVHLGHGPATYRRTGTPDVPAVCDACGVVTDIPHAELQRLAKRLRDRYGFAIDLHHFALTGRCERCMTGRAGDEPATVRVRRGSAT